MAIGEIRNVDLQQDRLERFAASTKGPRGARTTADPRPDGGSSLARRVDVISCNILSARRGAAFRVGTARAGTSAYANHAESLWWRNRDG